MSTISDMVKAATTVTPRVATAAAVTTATSGAPTATSTTAAGTAGATQAQQGATQAQAQAQAEAEARANAFTATSIDLPAQPTTNDVLNGLAKAIADPSNNAATAKRLYEFHQEMLERQRAMIAIYLERQS